jgi:hypothetical protein
VASIGDEGYKQEMLKQAQQFSRPDPLTDKIVSKVEARLR